MNANLEELLKEMKENARAKENEFLERIDSQIKEIFEEYNKKTKALHSELNDIMKKTADHIRGISEAGELANLNAIQNALAKLEDVYPMLKSVKQKQEHNEILCFVILGINIICLGTIVLLFYLR